MFELSADHESFRAVVRDFAETEIAPHVAQWDRDHHLPTKILMQMGELGLFGLIAPEEYGGSGADFTSLCVAIEEIGRVDQSIGATLEAGVGLGINPIVDIRHRRAEGNLAAGPGVRPRARGVRPHRARGRLGRRRDAYPGRCSTTAVGRSTARSRSSPTPAPTSPRSSPITARTGHGRDLDHHGSGRHARPHRRAGLRQARLAHLRHARAELRRLPGAGGRTCSAPAATGSGSSCPSSTTAASPSPPSPSAWPRPAWTQSAQYALERHTFGAPIGSRQAVAFSLSDLAVSVEAARLLTYKAAWLKDAGRPAAEIKQAASMAKLFASDAAVNATRVGHPDLRR